MFAAHINAKAEKRNLKGRRKKYLNMDNKTFFYAFRQGVVQNVEGEGGNCTSVALIKAAVDVLGIDKVFEERKTAKGIECVLKDKTTLALTTEELALAKKESAFVICEDIESDEEQKLFTSILNCAHRCFAVIAKHVQLNGELYDGSRSKPFKTFEEALESVNDGLYAPLSYHYLGLSKNVERMPNLSRTVGKHGIVTWSAHHTVYACDGYYDLRGVMRKMRPKYFGRFRIVA